MSRVHDMGGRFGDGPIPQKDDNVVFHNDWEAHALALNLACGALGEWNIDASRHARECLSPKDYMTFSYYEKWVSGLTDILVQRGVITADEIKTAVQAITDGDELPAPTNSGPKALKAENVEAGLRMHVPYTRESGPRTAFAVGDAVRTISPSQNQTVQGGHTRLPAYAAGRSGVIARLQGSHVFPDSNAHFLGEAPEPLYAVRFSAKELWGSDAESTADDMVLDLWQSYLMAAPK